MSPRTIRSYTEGERQHCLCRSCWKVSSGFLQSRGSLGFCRWNVQINNRLLREVVEFHAWKYSKHNWTRPRASCYSWLCSAQGVGQGHLQRCQPASAPLWACHSVNSKLCLPGLDMLQHEWLSFKRKKGYKNMAALSHYHGKVSLLRYSSPSVNHPPCRWPCPALLFAWGQQKLPIQWPWAVGSVQTGRTEGAWVLPQSSQGYSMAFCLFFCFPVRWSRYGHKVQQNVMIAILKYL